MRPNPNRTTWLYIAGFLVIVALICAGSFWIHGRQTQRCHNLGGTVVTDHDTKRVYDKKTGKWKNKTETEHECIVDGQEVFEW